MSRPRTDPYERFVSNITILPNGCWEWTGGRWQDGYGRFFIGRQPMLAHRWAFENLLPIAIPQRRKRKRVICPPNIHPHARVLDHTCHTNDLSCKGGKNCPHRRCVNPSHLRVTSVKDNILVGRGPGAQNARQTQSGFCRQGHALTEDNLYIANGRKRCRECMRLKDLRRKQSEAGKAYDRQYAQTEQRKTYLTNYRQQHAEKHRAYQKERWAARKEEIRAQRAAKLAALSPAELEAHRQRNREYMRKHRAKRS